MFLKMKQSQKEIALILLAFFVLIMFSAVSRYYALNQIRELKRLAATITEHPLKVSNAALSVQINTFKFRQQMVQIVFFPDKTKLAERIYKVHEFEKEAHNNLDIVQNLILGKKGQLIAHKTDEVFHERSTIREVVIAYVLEGNMEKAVSVFKANEASYILLDSLTLQLNAYARGKVALYDRQSNELYAQFERNNSYIMLTLLFLFALIIYYTVHRISTYISSSEKLTLALSVKSGELQHALQKEFEKEEALLEQAHIFDALQDSIILHDLEGRFIYLNENAWKTRGYTYEEMMGMTIKEIIAPECENGDPQRLKAAANKMREDGYVRIQVKHLCKNGDRMDVEVYAKLITYRGQPCILKSIRDITKQLHAQMEIKKLSIVVEQIDDAVMITDINGLITYVNSAFCGYTGYEKDEILGNTPRMFKSNHQSAGEYKKLWKTILEGNVYRETMVNKKKNGDLYFENKTITPLRDENEAIIGFVSTGKDVTQEMLAHQEIERMATIDQLTGIYNRHKFEKILILETQRSRRTSQPLSLILIDIDHFKDVNDTHGHDAGDEVLKHLVKVVQDNIRQIDVFARWGGEEFLVLSPSTDLEKVQMLAKKLRFAVEKEVFPIVSHITISQGVGIFEANDTFDEVFKRVDQGLYWAKEHGRNQVGVAVR